MNQNLIRTIIGVLGFIIVPVISLLGCSFDEITGTANCSASWIPPQYIPVLTPIIGVVVYAIKMFGGSGTVKQNMANPEAPIVPSDQAKPGVVTPAQVAAPK